MIRKRILYIFLDEGGDLDFSSSGTKYFTLTGLSKERPFEAYKSLNELKYDQIESDTEIEYFHASEDRQVVRDAVFNIINSHLDQARIDSIIVEKRKASPPVQEEERFYPDMLGYLLRYIIKGYDLSIFEKVIIFTDSLPIKRKRKAIEKAVKMTLAQQLPRDVRYRIFHHDSKSNKIKSCG